MHVAFDKLEPASVGRSVVAMLQEKGIACEGDRIIMTRGDLLGDQRGGSNTMKVIDINKELLDRIH